MARKEGHENLEGKMVKNPDFHPNPTINPVSCAFGINSAEAQLAIQLVQEGKEDKLKERLMGIGVISNPNLSVDEQRRRRIIDDSARHEAIKSALTEVRDFVPPSDEEMRRMDEEMRTTQERHNLEKKFGVGSKDSGMGRGNPSKTEP